MGVKCKSVDLNSANMTVPGPGTYQINAKDKNNLSYSMRPKVAFGDPLTILKNPGPGT
jgi:hypothetical protein